MTDRAAGDQATGAADWVAFEERLARFMRALNEDESVVLAVSDSDHSAKVLALGGGYLHAELSLARKADPSGALVLGWQDSPHGLLAKAKLGPRKLNADVSRREAPRPAGMLVSVLRDVWSTNSPQSLRVSAPDGGPPVEQLQIPVGKG